jgi:pilus assembly protein CpaC
MGKSIYAFLLSLVYILIQSSSALAEEDAFYLSGGQSLIINVDQNFGRIILGDPELIEAVPIDKTSFYLVAKKNGKTTIQVFAENKVDLIRTFVVQSGPDLKAIETTLSRIAPTSDIQIYFENAALQMVGRVPDLETKDLVVEAVRAITDVTPLSALRLDRPKQVHLKVRFIEVSRSLNGDISLGLNGSLARSGSSLSFGNLAMKDAFATVSIIDSVLNIEASLKALEEQGYAKYLAEPTLTALSGEEAEFLAGGEVPITTVGSDGVASTQYKDYGIKLTFTPIVDQYGNITLTLAPEVSQVDFGNLSNGQPSFTTRRVATTVELKDNQSLVLAGLYQKNDSRAKTAVPGLADLPIIGGMFRGSQLRGGDSEIIIIVTPSLSKMELKDNLSIKKINSSYPSDPNNLINNGILESSGYDLEDLISGKNIFGPFGPMIKINGIGLLNGNE